MDVLLCTGHYVPLLSLAVAQYSRANADSGFNLQGMAVGERAVLSADAARPTTSLVLASVSAQPKPIQNPNLAMCYTHMQDRATVSMYRGS